jgi:alkylation response protein AidB-like acyl-CoA dehydrogenase
MNYVSLGSRGTVPAGIDPAARARDLGPEIAAAADDIERNQAIPEPLLTHLHQARLTRILLPRSVDGDQLEPWTYLHAIEEISRHDGSVGWNLFVANSAALIAPFIPLETAREIFTDPRAWVSWGPPNQYKAQAVTGGYRVSGEWHFASGSRQANWMGAHCQVVEPDGSLRLNRFGRPTTRTLLFRKEHAEPICDWDTIGMRGTASEGYRVTDLFVPEAYSGTREDPALRRDTGPLYAFTMPGLYAVGVAGVAFGIARAMLDEFICLAAEKTPRGLQRLADSPVVQADVARRQAQLGAARAWLVEILKDVWAAADDIAPIELDARVRVRLGCAHAITSAIEVADYVYKAAGTSAIFRGKALERRFRDIHTLSQQVQSRDAHFEAVGRVMFNGDPDGLFL